MKYNLTKIIFILLLFMISFLGTKQVLADWWERSDIRPTQPNMERTLPTIPSQPTSIVSSPTPFSISASPTLSQPTTTPRVGEPTGSAEGEDEDPCTPGKSYTGSYCGWSPKVGGIEGDGSGGQEEEIKTFVPSVLGLSDTAGENLQSSDIIFLLGILCLLLYLKSKLNVKVVKSS